MAKPSEEINKKLLEFVRSHPEVEEGLNQAKNETDYAAIASATIIQCILDWLDEKFPE